MYSKIIVTGVLLLSQLFLNGATSTEVDYETVSSSISMHVETNTKTKTNSIRRTQIDRHQSPVANNNVVSAPRTSPPPTKYPTHEPTKNPTEAPTKHPTGEPTKHPTVSPTTSPTASPTYSPVEKGSPTRNPSPSPSESPTRSLCQVTNGVYGTSTSANSSSKTVTYYYEMALLAGNNDDITTALTKVEAAMAKSLIKRVESSCGGVPNRVRNRNRILSASDILGLTSSPADTVMENKSCENIQDSSTTCKVVKGDLTIYLSSQASDNNSVVRTILVSIQSFMNQTSDDVSLYYLQSPSDDITANQGVTNLIDEPGGGNTRTTSGFTIMPVFASVACAFIVVGVYVGRKSIRARRKEMLDRSRYLDDDNSVIDDVGLNSFGSNFNLRPSMTLD